ncbi:PorP/SprF family type IX secretion system membrane protein [bacterium SCSIO 12741]|nr:PorP/SprF family type IX secretion system membrane protein [bacterium SCSIO 12741]
MIKSLIRLITLTVGLGIGSIAVAQEEVHFSQFSDATVMFNPATSGVFYGSLRFNGHYRTQWGQTGGNPYTTMGASLDMPILSDVTGQDFFALGAYAFKDDAGVSQSSNFSGGLNLAFGKSFDPDENHFWSVGLKGTFNQKSMNYNGLNWGSQWNQIGFDQTIPGEYAGEASKTYFGMGAGFHHFYSNHSNIRTMFGVAINNLNRPKVQYLNTEYQLSSSIFINGEIELHSHSDNFAFIPRGAMMFQGNERYYIIGTSVDFVLKEAGKITGNVQEVTLEFGGFYRWGDAVILETQFNWAGLGVGFSYDLTLSSLSQAVRYQGAMEVLLHYKLGYKKGIQTNHSNDRFDRIH